MKDILVVEDGKPERERLQKLFTQNGYAVVTCESVTEAEEALKKEEFRLAILDIGLGDRSGSFLFSLIKRDKRVSYAIIFTGNPSVHLKKRFMEEGAVDYIVKGSPEAQNDSFLGRVREVIGEAHSQSPEGIALELFLERYVTASSKELFLDSKNNFPVCTSCGARQYQVIFSHQPQVPPDINGKVICANCGKGMDPELS